MGGRRQHAGVEQLTVQPIKEISGHVKLPGSKSLSNRILLLAALAEGTTLVKNLLVGGSVTVPTSGIIDDIRILNLRTLMTSATWRGR